MTETPVAVRLGLWRVTRHERVREVYDRLAAAGVFFAQLERFERDTAVPPSRSGVADVALSVRPAAETLPAHLEDAPVSPDDRVVLARRGGDVVGCCCLSDRPVYVPELRRRLRFDGAYLWRLYVEPQCRGHGIGSAIVARAVRASAAEFDVGRLVALVAPDNLPSRKAFRGLGFRPTERFTSAGALGREFHRRSTLDR